MNRWKHKRAFEPSPLTKGQR
uniref:Uncharacterized protein n=1 Tax=Anguilla anguilla TaxID=7936 RepID=A0A0E9QWP8_ANGAN